MSTNKKLDYLFNIFPAETESAFDFIDNSPIIRNAALWAFS